MNDFSPERKADTIPYIKFRWMYSLAIEKKRWKSWQKISFSRAMPKWRKKEPNRLDYRTDFRDVSRLFLHHFAPSFLRKICDFCSIDNIFSIFGAKTDVQKATTLLSPLPPFRALCIITNSVERWVCMWIRTARRPAFHASSFPKSLIFRMVFVLQNAKFMLLLTREWMEEEERTRSGKKKIWWKCDSFRISWCSFSFGVFRFPI